MEKRIKIILIAGFLLRCAVLFVTDLENINFYEYGEIVKNIIKGDGFSLFSVFCGFEQFQFHNQVAYSSAFMPPGHVYFLLPFFYIEDAALRSAILIFVQAIISTATIYLMYYYVKRFFNQSYAFLAALITALNPEFIYTVKFGTPTVVYHFLVVSLIITLYSYFDKKNSWTIITAGFFSSLLIYFRSEMALYIALVWVYFLYRKDYKNLFYYIAVVVVFIAPWSVRNYMTFNKPVPLATSFGINLYKGNNPQELGSLGTMALLNKIKYRAETKPFEIALNEVYTEEAVNHITNHPIKSVYCSIIKLFDLWIYNMHIQQVKNILAVAAYSGFFIIFLIGYIYIYDKNKFPLENFMFITSSISAMIFFVLPRYQTMLHILMMPFCAVGISVVFNYLINIYNKIREYKTN